MTEQTEFSRLFRKYIDGSATAEETQLFLSMADQASLQEELARLVDLEMLTADQPFNLDQQEKQAILENIFSAGQVQQISPGRTRRLWPRIVAAASVILCLSVGGYFIFHKTDSPNYAGNLKADIKHGSNGAVLTLANGKKVILDETKVGDITRQNGTNLQKAGDSLLVYQSGETTVVGNYYNTLETPRGKQYSVVLPDGTKVWLNAASSLKYPTTFSGKDRKVELAGEAYFEVAHNKAKPFKVLTNGQTVEVLGTHFNIKAYADEPATWTTLLQGSVKVEDNRNHSALLIPGQQAVSGNNGALQTLNKVDMDAVLDWKNGEFVFSGESLESIMRKVSRWYDAEVEYKDEALKKEHFFGSVSKWSSASDVLDALALTGTVKFSIVGGPKKERRIIVAK
ncbi:MAG: FecR domain-containing protein [Bacteroidota bacterium]